MGGDPCCGVLRGPPLITLSGSRFTLARLQLHARQRSTSLGRPNSSYSAIRVPSAVSFNSTAITTFPVFLSILACRGAASTP